MAKSYKITNEMIRIKDYYRDDKTEIETKIG